MIKYTPMPEIGENAYKTEVIMTKEVFKECFKKWVKTSGNEVKPNDF